MPVPLIPFAVIAAGSSLGLFAFSKAADKTSDLFGSGTKLLLAGVAGAALLHVLNNR